MTESNPTDHTGTSLDCISNVLLRLEANTAREYSNMERCSGDGATASQFLEHIARRGLALVCSRILECIKNFGGW